MLSTLILLSAFHFNSHASSCPDLYPKKTELVPANTVEICNSFFVSRYDPNNRAVVLVSEKLTKGSDVGKETRVNAFHADSRTKNSPEPSEYVNTGCDKGHMAPAGDSASADQMHETFVMTNMTPQVPTLNRLSWKDLEENVRKQFSKANSDMWVVNIALYQPNSARIGKGIPVPTGYWKIVYVGSETQFYFAENKPNAKVVQMYNIDVDSLIKNSTNF